MSLVLPSAIEAEVHWDDGSAVPDALVALHLRMHDRYYYGTLLGLTAGDGSVRLTRDALEQDFGEDRRLFPMDYRVPLAECDPVAEVRVDGGAEFARRRAAIDNTTLISPAAAALWRAALNERLQPAVAEIRLDAPNVSGTVRAAVIVRPEPGMS